MKTIRPILSVPYYAQFESAAHIADYVTGKKSLAHDPYWANSGAGSPEEYAYWANRSCGMVCVKTCIEAFGGPVLPLHTWIQRGLAANAYLTEKRGDNTTVEKGWLHAGLAAVMNNEGLKTKVKAASVEEIVSLLQNGCLVIASVSYEIGTIDAISHQGGHLVTVIGAQTQNGNVKSLHLHNPSGRTPALRENAIIPASRFQQAFSGRVIVVGKVD